MPSFDIVNEVDVHLLENAINTARKEITNRFDFRGSNTSIEINKKEKNINILTEDDMRLKSVVDVIRMRMAKQQIDPKCLDEGKEQYASGSMVRKDIKIKEGIDRETAKKLIKLIKDSKLKVTAQIMDELVRVQGKKLDDLQAVIALVRRENFEVPLQFINMKS